MIDDFKKEQIALEVIKTLFSRFENFPEDSKNNRNAPFHEAFLNAFSDKLKSKVSDIPFFISLSSWLHGLNTTLGQSFFENVAHILSDGYKKEFTKSRGTLLKIDKEQKRIISDIITDLKNGTKLPATSQEDKLIFYAQGKPNTEANSFTVDIFLEYKNKVIAVELKSVKPNAGEMRGEKQKILEAKASLFNEYRGKKIKYFIGFPFDPTSDKNTGYNKSKFLSSLIDGKKYFSNEEILLASELWDLLSGQEHTMEQILEIINHIATPKFLDNYNFLINTENFLMDQTKYKDLLKGWYLFRELYLLSKWGRIEKDSKKHLIAKHPLFKAGQYNFSRYESLARDL